MLTNAKFTKENVMFLKACKIVQQSLLNYKEFKPTTRQASKFRRRKGIAYRNYISDLPKEVRCTE